MLVGVTAQPSLQTMACCIYVATPGATISVLGLERAFSLELVTFRQKNIFRM